MNDNAFNTEDYTKAHETMKYSFDKIEEIDKKIKEAHKKAEMAREKAYENNSKVGKILGHQKGILENREANKMTTDALFSTYEVTKLMFEHLKQLGNIADCISNLGASSIAANTIILDKLRTYLTGSKAANLSDFSRKKLLELTKKLELYKSQMEIQEKNSKFVEENTEQIAKINRWIDTVDDQLSDIKGNLDELDIQMEEIYNRIDEIDIQVSDNTKHLERHDAEILHLQEKVNQRHKSLELADAVIDKVQQVDVKKTGSKAFGYVLLVLGGYFLFCVVLGLFALTISGTFATMETAEMIGTIVFLVVIGVISFFVFWKGRKRVKRK